MECLTEGMPVASQVGGDEEVGYYYCLMPVESWVCQGDGSGNKELDVADRSMMGCLTVGVCL